MVDALCQVPVQELYRRFVILVVLLASDDQEDLKERDELLLALHYPVRGALGGNPYPHLAVFVDLPVQGHAVDILVDNQLSDHGFREEALFDYGVGKGKKGGAPSSVLNFGSSCKRWCGPCQPNLQSQICSCRKTTIPDTDPSFFVRSDFSYRKINHNLPTVKDGVYRTDTIVRIASHNSVTRNARILLMEHKV
ncbi:hypothetical protein SAMN04488057_11248 [Cyclobacterium lianum]|uniref:Uncharacterized protein n=1 Tax=Cyclobacterium lianum TaxID=388280 RepID=A0A1M7PZ61_9BACT|nr:hypothetical protein SAMN04488057_11248 [Cyclobacterium lianum]